MRKRYKQSKSKTRKVFGRTADRTHKMNLRPRPMRGGTRL
jgi:hypothetical protein